MNDVLASLLHDGRVMRKTANTAESVRARAQNGHGRLCDIGRPDGGEVEGGRACMRDAHNTHSQCRRAVANTDRRRASAC